jgi:hypothetical protein
MADVAYLPDPMRRQWLAFATAVRVSLIERGHAPAAIDRALQGTEPVFMRCAGRHRVGPITPGTIDEELQRLSDWVADFGTALMLEVVLRELELQAAGLR